MLPPAKMASAAWRQESSFMLCCSGSLWGVDMKLGAHRSGRRFISKQLGWPWESGTLYTQIKNQLQEDQKMCFIGRSIYAVCTMRGKSNAEGLWLKLMIYVWVDIQGGYLTLVFMNFMGAKVIIGKILLASLPPRDFPNQNYALLSGVALKLRFIQPHLGLWMIPAHTETRVHFCYYIIFLYTTIPVNSRDNIRNIWCGIALQQGPIPLLYSNTSVKSKVLSMAGAVRAKHTMATFTLHK